MTDRNLLVAPLALAALIGIAGYLVWPEGSEVAPGLLERSPMPVEVGEAVTEPMTARSDAVEAPQRTVVEAPDAEEQRAAWQRDAAAIQKDLIAALLSGDDSRIKAAEQRARDLAAANNGR